MEWKQQIIKNISNNACCGHSFISVLLKNCAIIDTSDQYILFNISNFVADKVADFIKKFSPTLEILRWDNFLMLRGDIYEFLIDYNYEKINLNLFDLECDRLTILKTLIVLYTNLYYNKDSNQNSTGYNFEILVKDKDIANVLTDLLKEFGFELKTTKRQSNTLIYTKNSELICDLLVKLGANHTALEIQNNLAMREVRNSANRQNNCFGHNLDKTLNSSAEQMEAINFLFSNDLLDNLDEKLKEVALLRLANPEVSLSDLKTLLGKPISRAGLKYRLDKIIDIYKKLKGENK